MLRMFNKFPRQGPKRKMVESLQELLEMVNKFNGIDRTFVSLYNYIAQEKIDEQNLDLDKIFFDFDHEKKCLEDIKRMHKWLMEKSYKHIMFLSGKGFHVYILTTNYLNVKNKRDCLYNAHTYIADQVGFSFGDPKVSSLDFHIRGNLAQMVTFPGTWNTKRRRYCICVTEEDLVQGYDFIREKAKKPNLFFKYYGKNLFDIKKFDVDIPKNFGVMNISSEVKANIDKDKFLQNLPECVATLLNLPHIGYRGRGVVICYFRDTGHLLSETISILDKYMKDRAEFVHCTTRQIAQGYKERGEEQPQYFYRDYVKSRTSFPSCEKIRELGFCPVKPPRKCKNWKVYK